MALKVIHNQRLVQRLAFTPQMQQAIYILQLPIIDLQQTIQEEMVSNPLLNNEDLPTSDSNEEKAETTETDKETETMLSLDENMDNYLVANEYIFDRDNEQKKRDYLESIVCKPLDLATHLKNQICIFPLSEQEYIIADHIIGNIDDNGYLRASIDEIAATLHVTHEQTENILSIIQTLDPIGIGSRNLTECLLTQLEIQGKKNSLAYKIVAGHLRDLQKKRFEPIAKKLKVSLDDIKTAIEIIHKLEPKPGRNFSVENVRCIYPDIFVRKIGNDYEINLNEDDVPNLKISETYRRLLFSKETSKEIKTYIKEKLSSALWIIKAINQRQQTLWKISSFIFAFQKDALNKGLGHLRPLTIKQIAERVDLHESTVSRAIMNKYAQTPIGLFALKNFLSRRFETTTDGSISSDFVKAEMQKLINTENNMTPLSDEKIAKIFKEKGWHVARRTIAKYREELNIPTSSLRKREHMLS